MAAWSVDTLLLEDDPKAIFTKVELALFHGVTVKQNFFFNLLRKTTNLNKHTTHIFG